MGLSSSVQATEYVKRLDFISSSTPATSPTSPGGTSGTVQFNNGTTFAGNTSFTTNGIGGISLAGVSATAISATQFTGPLSSTPTYSFVSNTNTGIAQQVINSVDVITAGATNTRFTSTGLNLVGNEFIGSSTATASATLHVSGTARIVSWTMIGANAAPTTPLEVSGLISSTQVSSSNIIARNISVTNIALTSSTLLAGQSLYARLNGAVLVVDGAAGYQYNQPTNRSMFSESDLAANITPSATVVVSGTTMLGNCNAAVTCGAPQESAVCYGTTRKTYYVCNGLNSWIPLVSTTAVSASGSM